MEPVLWERPFTSHSWLFEMERDGVRVIARKEGDGVELISHNGRSLTSEFPEVVAALATVRGDWHLDAELVVHDERGHPAWGRLRRRAVMRRQISVDAAARVDPATLCVFDILTLGRTDLRHLSTKQRRARLAKVFPPTPGVQIVSALDALGDVAFAKACELNLEGVVAKRIDAPYQSGKRTTWRKIRNPHYSRQKELGSRSS